MMQATPLSVGVDRAALMAAAGPRPQHSWLLLDYDTRRYPFAALLSRDVFKVQRLELLHHYLQQLQTAEGCRAGSLRPRDNLTLTCMMERQPADAAFYRLYHSFMLQRLAPLVGRGISYTSHPKLRVHLAGTPSVSSFHHDICVTERIDQVNFWMPFTDVQGGATLWLESDYGKCDFAPVTVRYGQILIFDGGYIGHGSMHNDSGRTRVSLDMRFSYKKATTRAEGVALLDHLARVLEPVAVREGEPI
ncbi:TPA: hypothetical protein SIA26_001784 [Aeromonas bestiarum]|nr:hypothetical protein [Aeromonas bestiarum]